MIIASPLLNILIKSIRNIRKFLLRDFDEIEKLQSSIKKNDNFINNTKLKLESEVNQILQKIKPGIPLVSNKVLPETSCWILDYSDFYFNFSRANENLGLGIAYKNDNFIQTYLFYNPIKDYYFFFEKGLGAYKNDSRIRVSNKQEKHETIISIYKKYQDNDDKKLIKVLKSQLCEFLFNQRESGSLNYDLCELASGKVDCTIFVNPSTKIDLISKLIISESGGKINIFEYEGNKIFVCTNKLIEKTVKEMVENNIIT